MVRHDAEGCPMIGTDATIRMVKTIAPAWAVVALGLLVSLAAQSATAQPASSGRETVAEVLIVGNKRVATERIMREVHTRPTDVFSTKSVQDDVNRLSKTHLFKHLSVRTHSTNDGRITVIFEVLEHPNIVREVVFKHAKHFSDDELMTMSRIRKGMPLDKTLNQLAVYEIQDAYKKKGRYLASVSLEEGFDESHSRVVFNITEGPIVRVRSTNFTGNTFQSGARLRTQIETSRALLQSLGGVYQPAMVDEDINKLEEYYRANGFLNVRVAREVNFSDGFQFVDLVYHIQEGLQFRVKSTTIDGAKSLPSEQLGSIVRQKNGDFYNENVVTADQRNLADFFGWRGYPVNIQKQVTSIPGEPGVVRVAFQIEEKTPVTVGKVIIVGNTVTKDSVIRRAIGIYSGQVLRFPELRLAEKALARLGIFEMNPETGGKPTISAIPTDDPTVQDILVVVKETHTGSFQIGAGYNTNTGLVGTVTLNERNFDIGRWPTSWSDVIEGKAFRGGNQDLQIQAVPGLVLQRYSVTWRDPMLFDLPYALIVSGYFRQQQYNEYLEQRVGTRITVAKQILPGFSVNAGFRVEDIGVAGVSFATDANGNPITYDANGNPISSTGAFAFGAPRDYTSVQGSNFLVAPRIGATFDRRDSFLKPTEGGIVDVSYEEAYSHHWFPIVNAKASYFFTVWQRKDGSGKHVLALHSQVGIENGQAPVYERFFAGGIGSLRGFQYRGVGPNLDGFMLGGSFLFLNSIQYSVPVLASDALQFVTFVDSGTVESHIGITEYRVSVGVGLRISIPQLGPVPIGVDFGFPLIKSATDQTQIFNIAMGTQY
jgi:outer membrane protein insertion porin family